MPQLSDRIRVSGRLWFLIENNFSDVKLSTEDPTSKY